MITPSMEQALLSGIKALALDLDEAKLGKLQDYLALLIKWNKAYNLTAVRDSEEMVSRHLLDSLSVIPHIKREPIIDVGSGPGLPGIPLAICFPDLAVTTLDSNGKKTRFQNQAKLELGLDNLTVVKSRVELYTEVSYPQVISRAFASIEDMIKWTQHLCDKQGTFLAMKGQYPNDELKRLPAEFSVRESHQLHVPGTEGERHLLEIERA
ncbi:MAG: 16S rRNA (guanine(527)-N(7))-methyltransferase RsmG [Pontibacterium sp.]